MFLNESTFLKNPPKLNLKHIYIYIYCSLWSRVIMKNSVFILLRYVVSQVLCKTYKHSWPWLTQIVLSLNLFRICFCNLLVNKICLATADLKFIYLPTSIYIEHIRLVYTQSTHIVYDTMLITDRFQFFTNNVTHFEQLAE